MEELEVNEEEVEVQVVEESEKAWCELSEPRSRGDVVHP